MLVKDLLVSLEKLGSGLDNYIVRRIVNAMWVMLFDVSID